MSINAIIKYMLNINKVAYIYLYCSICLMRAHARIFSSHPSTQRDVWNSMRSRLELDLCSCKSHGTIWADSPFLLQTSDLYSIPSWRVVRPEVPSLAELMGTFGCWGWILDTLTKAPWVLGPPKILGGCNTDIHLQWRPIFLNGYSLQMQRWCLSMLRGVRQEIS